MQNFRIQPPNLADLNTSSSTDGVPQNPVPLPRRLTTALWDRKSLRAAVTDQRWRSEAELSSVSFTS